MEWARVNEGARQQLKLHYTGQRIVKERKDGNDQNGEEQQKLK